MCSISLVRRRKSASEPSVLDSNACSKCTTGLVVQRCCMLQYYLPESENLSEYFLFRYRAFSQGELPERVGGKTSELLCNKSICNPDLCNILHGVITLQWVCGAIQCSVECVYRKVNKCPQKQQNKKRCGCPLFFYQFKGPKNGPWKCSAYFIPWP